ncbi:MAG: GNAT family N-acetyltransferase, partial [Aeromonas veronii]
MNWILKPWSELTTDELYELLALRAEVFVVEQTCPFQDLDGLDRREGVWHLLGYQGDLLAAYARIMAPGIGDESGSAIGRVVTSPKARGGGLGHQLISEAVKACEARWPTHSIWLGAQAHL